MSRSSARKQSSWRTGLGQLNQYDAVEMDVIDSPTANPSSNLPRIAICTPSFNQAPFLDQTIASVLSQGYTNLDYWVQDGGSTDESSEVLARWAESGLRYAIADDDGQADAINKGFAQVDGEIMAWLNSDDLLLPGSLEAVGRVFAEQPEVDVVYGHRILVDTAGRDIGRWIMPKHDDEILTWADYVPQETMFWRRSLWDTVGSQLDISFRFALDWDLILRFREAGAKFHRIPQFLGAFRIHEEQKTSAQMESLGDEEMARLRTREQGRPVTDREVWEHTKPYLVKASLYSSMWKLGLVDYGPI